MLDKDPKKRPSASECLEEPWLKKYASFFGNIENENL